MSLRIREMQQADVERVLQLAAESAEAPRWPRHTYEQLLPSAPPGPLMAACWVAQTESQLAGFAVARWLPGESAADIESLAVAQPCRRQGIGTALVKACMEWATRSGAGAVRLEVRQSNTGALALYRALGFATAGVRRAYYTAPVEDAYILEAPSHTAQ